MPITYSPFPRPMVTTVWSEIINLDGGHKAPQDSQDGEKIFVTERSNKDEFFVYFKVNNSGSILCNLILEERNAPAVLTYTNMLTRRTASFQGSFFPHIGLTVLTRKGKEQLAIILVPRNTERYVEQVTFSLAVKALKPDIPASGTYGERAQALLNQLAQTYDIILLDLSNRRDAGLFDLKYEGDPFNIPDELVDPLLIHLKSFL